MITIIKIIIYVSVMLLPVIVSPKFQEVKVVINLNNSNSKT